VVTGWIPLPDGVLDAGRTRLVLKDGIAYLGGSAGTTLFNLQDPTQPVVAGVIVGMGGMVGITDSNILVSAKDFYGATPGGLQTAALQTTAVITDVTMSGTRFNDATGTDVTESNVQVTYRVLPDGYPVETAVVDIDRTGPIVQTLPATVAGTGGTAIWPAQSPVVRDAEYRARVVVNASSDRPLTSAWREVPLVDWVFVTPRGQQTYAPPQSAPTPVITLAPVTPADVTFTAGGQSAQVRVQGEITDDVADLTAAGGADITSVTIEGQTFPVTRMAEPRSAWRPYAFRSRFQGTVTVDISDGRNTVVAETTNAVGGQGYDSVTLNVTQTFPPLPPPWTRRASTRALPIPSRWRWRRCSPSWRTPYGSPTA
jgi:hypothetical protein